VVLLTAAEVVDRRHLLLMVAEVVARRHLLLMVAEVVARRRLLLTVAEVVDRRRLLLTVAEVVDRRHLLLTEDLQVVARHRLLPTVVVLLGAALLPQAEAVVALHRTAACKQLASNLWQSTARKRSFRTTEYLKTLTIVLAWSRLGV
jgi:hypothetical protein